MFTLRQARFFTAGIVSVVLAALSCVQFYYDKHPQSFEWFKDERGISVLGFVHDVDLATRHFKVRWKVVGRNVVNESPVIVYIDQSPLSPDGRFMGPNKHAQSFALEKGSDDVQPVTHHTFITEQKAWAKNDDPFPYPFDRYSYTGHIAVMDGPTYAPVTFHHYGFGDNSATKHYSPVLVLRIDPDHKRDNATEVGTEEERALKSFAGLVERPIPVKVSVLGMFGASWLLTLGVLGTLVAPLVPFLNKKGITTSWRAIRLAPLAVIVPVVIMREMATKDGRPSFGDGVLIDYLGVFLQIVLVLVVTVAVGVVKRRQDSARGAIALNDEETP